MSSLNNNSYYNSSSTQQQPLLLKNIISNYHQNDLTESATTKLECVPSSAASNFDSQQEEVEAVDIGILDCGTGQYCLESSNSSLGGICVNDYSDEEDHKDNNLHQKSTTKTYKKERFIE